MIDPSAAGRTNDPYVRSWDVDDCLLYALSVGAGRGDLAYTTENSEGVDQKVLPTFPSRFGVDIDWVLAQLGPFDKEMMVQASNAIEVHRPLPTTCEVEVHDRIADVFDKGSGALVWVESTATLDGAPLYTTRLSLFIRGSGGWGGERGPGATVDPRYETAPERTVTEPTLPVQGLLYRLNGPRNPIHSDPTVAGRAGFSAPILHGLCTYGFSGRALLTTYCDNDSDRFVGIEARFVSPVLPGDELTTHMWDRAPGEALFRTEVDGRPVIDGGVFRFRAAS